MSEEQKQELEQNATEESKEEQNQEEAATDAAQSDEANASDAGDSSDEKEESSASEEASSDDESGSEDDSEEVEVPEQFKAIVEQIENMTVLELNELVKVLEKKFGVSAQAVAVAAPGAGGAGGAEEKDEFDIVLSSVGDNKIQVIKVVKEVLGLGLKEAKEFVEGAPQTVKEGAKKEEAEEIKAKFEEVGASVELK